MKICPKCGKKYSDEYSFCNSCGCQIKPVNDKKKTYFAVGFITLVSIIAIAFAICEHIRISSTKNAIEEYKYQKAAEEYRNTPRKSDLEIGDDWTTESSGDYIYIKGSVINVSTTKTISYFEVEAKFYDSDGKVVDSDWTNDGKDLGPGESRQFEIMHKKNKNQKKMGLSIKDVR